MGLKRLLSDNLKDLVGKPLGLRGVAPADQWQRTVMNESIDSWIDSIAPATRSAVEVSGRERAHHRWGGYRTLDYPEFDLCGPSFEIDEQFDVVICEQVLEHVSDPWLALDRLFCTDGSRRPRDRGHPVPDPCACRAGRLLALHRRMGFG